MSPARWIQFFSGATEPDRNEIDCGKASAAFTEEFFCVRVSFLLFKIQLKIAHIFQAFVSAAQMREDRSRRSE